MNNNDKKTASTGYALLTLAISLAIILGGNIFLNAPIQPMFLIVWLFVIPACMKLGYSYSEIYASMLDSIKQGLTPILILIAVGSIISTWIAAGTVPAVIYYGLQIISPSAFLLATFVLCSMVSISCGTSWGTMGTAGIAMFAVGTSLGIPAGMTVGAIISGSFLGDMISPMSDSTNVASAASGTDLITHCKELIYVAAPAFLISCVFYYFIGLQFATDTFDNSYVLSIADSLAGIYNVGIFAFLPVVILLALLVLKKPAVTSMLISSISAMFVAVFYQGANASDVMNYFWSGHKIETGEQFLDTLLNRGGIQSMFATVCIMLFAFGMIGAFNKVGILEAIVNPISKKAKSLVQLTGVTQIIATLGNAMGTNTFSLLMTGSLMAPLYKERDLHPTNLSKIINATSTVVCVLIPWNISALYALGLFEISVIEYAPYAIFSYVMPIVGFLFVLFKVRIVPASIDLENGAKYKKEKISAK